MARAAAHAGYRTYFTTTADLAARCHRAAIEGRWATTMRFFAGPTLLVIDELGYLPLPGEAASALFQVVSQRYLKTSIVLTTNRGVASWGEVLGDTTVAAAMLDRLLHRSVVITLDGASYRLRNHANAADELAYSAHDLGDGLRSGMLSPNMLEGITLWEILVESVDWRGDELDKLTRHRMIRRLIGLEVNDLLECTNQTLLDNKVKTPKEIQELNKNVVVFSADMHRRNRQLKDFLYNNLYRHYRVVRMSNKAEKTISDLFNAYQTDPTMLSQHVQKMIEQHGLERTVCDYIAGMTDRFAIEEHKKLFDPSVIT